MAGPKWHDAHTAIAIHALPIIKDFKIFGSGFPKPLLQQMDGDRQRAQERWDDILLDIIMAFEHVVDEDWTPTKQEENKDQRSFELFGKWFTHLWD